MNTTSRLVIQNRTEFLPEYLLSKGGRMVQYEANQEVEANILETGLLFITYGVSKFYAISKDREIFVELLKRGDFFLKPSHLQMEFKPVLKASNKCMAVFLPMGDFDYLLTQEPDFARYFQRISQEKYEKAYRRNLINISLDIRENLIHFLTETAKENGNRKNNEIVIQNYLSHSDIANYLSTSRQTISVLLNQMRDKGLIDYSRKFFRLRNPAFFKL